jgi:hypothetical protein
MKINPLNEAMRWVTQVRGKAKDTEDSLYEKNRDNSQKDRRQSGQENHHDSDHPEHAERTELLVAVREFDQDSQNQANGLNATLEGEWPGLRVILKDRGGVVIRQFTGDEFMRLRGTACQDGRVRGKILDQKF